MRIISLTAVLGLILIATQAQASLPGQVCNELGTTQMSEDRVNIIACLTNAANTASSATCANSGGCEWKTTTGPTPVAYLYKFVRHSRHVTLTNTTGKNLMVTASGGAPSSCSKNNYELTAFVDGQAVARVVDNNPDWAKIGSVSFVVPPNSTYTVSSSPYRCAANAVFNLTAATF